MLIDSVYTENIEEGYQKNQTLGINGRRCLSTKRSLFFFSRTVQHTYPFLNGVADVVIV